MGKNKENINIVCPVCGNIIVVENDYEVSDLENFQCQKCGWINNDEQNNNPKLTRKINYQSLNQYRKWYEEKIKKDPNWLYFQHSRVKKMPHLCPVCGEYTFPNSMSQDICPICGWEDTGFEESPNEKPSKFMMSLNEHKKWFKQKRQENPSFAWKTK